MKQAFLLLVLAAATSVTPACDSEVPPAPRAATPPTPRVTAAPDAVVAAPPPPPRPVAAIVPAPPEPDPAPPPISAPITPAAPPSAASESEPAIEPEPDTSAAPAEASPFPADVVLATGPAWTAPAGRSPLGGPGESTPKPALRLGEVATADPTPATPAVPWDEAHQHVGEQITVEGRVVNTHRSKSNVVFLNFDRDWQGKFYVPVFRGAYETMPTAAEVFFLNRTVRVTGEVELFNGTPNIEVNELSQISVVR